MTSSESMLDNLQVSPNALQKVEKAAGGTNFENPLEKIEQLLTCPICLDRYKLPKLLPCQHTFCLACLDSYADTVHRNLKCPECRAEHVIDPYEGVKSFPPNLTLTGFLDIHLQATESTAAQFQTYIETYNLERCKICDEKAQLQLCAHCERKACEECRKTHMEMLKRDLTRLLNQVKRLSNRVKEASSGLDKSLNLLSLNGESTKAEIREYFHRYSRELKHREEYFLAEVECFVQNETRVMSTLRDVLSVENANLHDACVWVDAVLGGMRDASDDELSRVKSVFVDGLEYLRNFQPDSDDLFAKKLRFSPGDDASKLPTAISNFGELTVSLPQFSNRYLPLEEQYLPRPFRMPFESDSYRPNKTDDSARLLSKYGSKPAASDDRYRRRQQLEEEAWGRLRANSGLGGGGGGTSENGSRCVSPMLNTSPWGRAAVPIDANSPLPVTVPAPPPSRPEAMPPKEQTPLAESGPPAASNRASPSSALSVEVDSAPPSRIPKSSSPRLAAISPVVHSPHSARQSPRPSPVVSPSQKSSISISPKAKEPPKTSSNIGAPKKVVQKQNSREQASSRPSTATTSSTAANVFPAKHRKNSIEQKETSKKDPDKSFQNSAASKETSLVQAKALAQNSAVSKNAQAEELSQNFNSSSKISHFVSAPAAAQSQEVVGPAATVLPRPENQDSHKHQQTQSSRHQHHHRKPPLPRQNSSQDDKSLNEKVECIRQNHERINEKVERIRIDYERRIIERSNNQVVAKDDVIESKAEPNEEGSKEEEEEEEETDEEVQIRRTTRARSGSIISVTTRSIEERKSSTSPGRPKLATRQKFRILYRSSSSRPLNKESLTNSLADALKKNDIGKSTAKNDPGSPTSKFHPIPIAHYPGNSCGEWPPQKPNMERRFSRSNTNPDLTVLTTKNNDITVPASLSVAKSNGPSARVIQLLAEREETLLKNENVNNYSDKSDSSRRSRWHQGSPSGHSNASSEAEGDLSGRVESAASGRSRAGRRRSSIVPDRELSRESSKTSVDERRSVRRGSTARTKGEMKSFIDYDSKKKPNQVIGKRGSNAGEMNWPRGIGVMPGGEFAVCDSSNHRVQVYDSDGRLLRQFGKYGTEDGAFDSCAGVAYNHYRQQLVVSDRYNHRVQIFDLNGNFVRKFGSKGSTPGKFNNPWGVALDELGLIYVVDKDNHRVQVFDQNGYFMNAFGKMGDALGQFNHPLFIAIQKQSQTILVSDSANHRICAFSHDCTPLRVIGIEGFKPGELKLPRGVAVDHQGFVIVADSGNNRIQVFAPDGRSVRVFGAWGSAPGQLKGVEGVALMATQIICTDRENHRVQIF